MDNLQHINSNYNGSSYKIDESQEQCKCEMCGERDETGKHLASECKKMAQTEQKAETIRLVGGCTRMLVKE